MYMGVLLTILTNSSNQKPVSREDGVAFNQPGEVAGVADVPLHGVNLRRHGRLLAILQREETGGNVF